LKPEDLTPEQLEAFINDGVMPEEPVPTAPLIGIPVAPEPSGQIGPEMCHTPTTPTTPLYHDEGFDIKDPVELLFLLDDNVREGRVTLHPWQVQIMLDFAEGDHTDDRPFQGVVRACNGSGKDKYVIAPCSVWLCMRYKRSRCVITSSSGKQLDAQTCTYIDMLCEEANRKIAPNIWKLNYRYYECLATGSPIECFATDEAGKAEGFHPLEYGRKMGLFMSEAKSVPDAVNGAFNKCTGYTHRLHVSTPGLPMGHFYEYCQRSRLRKSYDSLTEKDPVDYVQYHVTAFDCSHLSRVYIEQMKRDLPGGESGSAYKSQVLAEFGTTDEMTVITYSAVWQAMFNPPKCGHLKDPFNTAGLDLAAGGDETAIAIRNGNKLLLIKGFHFSNTSATITYLEKIFKEYHLDHPKARIWGDAGGLGKPILDELRNRGWKNIHYVTNQGSPRDERVYKNKGAEMWFDFAKVLESREVWLLNDDKLKIQLSTRYYKITPDNRHQLESKLQARMKGHPSPDRADAVVLCYCDYKSRLEEPEYEKPYKPEDEYVPVRQFSLREWADFDNERDIKNPSRKLDFTVLREEIADLNKQRKTTTDAHIQ